MACETKVCETKASNIKQLSVSDQLHNLQKVCIESGGGIADWVLYAVGRYINTGRSSRKFDQDFCKLDYSELQVLIQYCLKHDLSDDGIISSAQKCVYAIAGIAEVPIEWRS